jgi:beta-galactosidase
VPAEVGILFDWESWWALELEGKPSSDVRLMAQLRAYYGPLFARNIAMDFVRPDADLSRYRLLLAPNLYLVGDEAARNIEQFVANGGTLVMSFFSGITDLHSQVRLGGYPAPFRALLGLRVEEFAPYAASQTNTISTQDADTYTCDLWSDLIDLEGAQAIASYRDDFYAHRPAITRHGFGQGVSYYLGTRLEDAGMDWLLARICAEAGLRPALAAPAGVEVVRRTDGARSWLFLLNHTDEAVEIPLDRPGHDLLSGTHAGGIVRLEPMGVAIVEAS